MRRRQSQVHRLDSPEQVECCAYIKKIYTSGIIEEKVWAMKKTVRVLAGFLFLFIATQCFAIARPYSFLLHSNRVFVESGTFNGDGIFYAILSGAKEIHSIDLSPKYYYHAKERFQNNDNINLYLGDSGKQLYDIIKNIDEPITFWLDAQFCGGDTAFNGKITPILDELEQIKQHHINTHTILIDDVRQFGTWYFDYITKEQLIEKIFEINPNYSISYTDGFVQDDILIAEVK